MSFAPTTKVGYEGGLAHDRQILDKVMKAGAADGGGFTAKVDIPEGAMKADTVEIGGEEKKSGVNKKQMVSTAVLLAGGALIGYLCKGPISKGVDTLKNAVGQFFSKGKPAELLESGKGLLEKAKGMIFAK
ncbi:hypothetical protein IJ707_03835 [bacterium]|nr:hypothetical protein [bacterium]